MERAGIDSLTQEKKVKSESLTIQNILDGNFECRFLSKSSERRFGTLGNSSLYELEVPHPSRDGEKWKTYVTIWEPNPIGNVPVYEIPDRQVTILTGHGEIPLTDKREVEERVVAMLQGKINETKNL